MPRAGHYVEGELGDGDLLSSCRADARALISGLRHLCWLSTFELCGTQLPSHWCCQATAGHPAGLLQ